MISSTDIQNSYIKLYSALRQYIWDILTVQQIAALETSVYDVFPCISDIQVNLQRLRSMVSPVLKEDEELRECLEDMQTILDQADSIYARLDQVQEVMSK